MRSGAIAPAAALLCAARVERRRLDRLPEACRPADEAAAYAIQDVLHERLTAAGWGPLAGHKIGCTTLVMQRFLGIPNPCAGGVFAPTVQHGRSAFRHADFRHAGVECEIAVRLAQDLPAEGAPYDRGTVAPAVGACMAAIEVVDDRYEDYRALDTPTLIADDFFNAGCVLGEPVERWRELDLAALRGRMTINGVEVGTGNGADILGHSLAALAWLANAMAGRGRQLNAGEFVLLGSVVETRWVEQGDLAVRLALEAVHQHAADVLGLDAAGLKDVAGPRIPALAGIGWREDLAPPTGVGWSGRVRRIVTSSATARVSSSIEVHLSRLHGAGGYHTAAHLPNRS